jgi:hypothetical protein
MLCNLCKNLSVAKGVREYECLTCKKVSIVNVNFIDMCDRCSDIQNICQRCGTAIHKLSRLENDILKEINRRDEYNYIARDSDGDLGLYQNEPYLDNLSDWGGKKIFTTTGNYSNFQVFNHLFQLAQVDNSPLLIADLIQ